MQAPTKRDGASITIAEFGANLQHWCVNKGTEPVVLTSSDLVPIEKMNDRCKCRDPAMHRVKSEKSPRRLTAPRGETIASNWSSVDA
jgi:hypothetical protein